MGLFRTKIGSNIYNETTCDKIIERLKKNIVPSKTNEPDLAHNMSTRFVIKSIVK